MEGKLQRHGNHACLPFFIGRWLSISPFLPPFRWLLLILVSISTSKINEDQRSSRDPKSLSRLRDECLLVRRENTSRYKENHKRNQESHPTKRSERTNELIGHTHLRKNSFWHGSKNENIFTPLIIPAFTDFSAS